MKITHLILFFIIASIIIIVGALLKITHTSLGSVSANHLLVIGLVSEALVLAALVYFLANKPKNNS